MKIGKNIKTTYKKDKKKLKKKEKNKHNKEENKQHLDMIHILDAILT